MVETITVTERSLAITSFARLFPAPCRLFDADTCLRIGAIQVVSFAGQGCRCIGSQVQPQDGSGYPILHPPPTIPFGPDRTATCEKPASRNHSLTASGDCGTS